MFTIPTEETQNSPWPIATRLLVSHPELAVLRDGLQSGWSLAFILRYGDWNRGQRMTLGTCQIPTGQGANRDLFEWMVESMFGFFPTFLITLNAEWWHEAGERRREILLFHEMCHAGQAVDKFGEPKFHRETGEPIPAIIGHDVEEFTAVVARYGGWKGDLAEFLAAAKRHDTNEIVERAIHVFADPDDEPPPAMF